MAQLQGFHRHLELRVLELHLQAVGFHGANVRRPLVDQRHVKTGLRQIGADAAADGADAQYGDFFCHGV